MDTYRVNRYDIANQSSYTNRLVQGGLRYQKLNLSSAGELELSGVGIKPSLSHTSLATAPGSFNCSDPVLNNIWNTGARTIQLNELPAQSVPNFWVITDQGAFVDSLAPQPFAADYATMLTSYDLEFSVKPISNGFGFTVLSDTLGEGIYIFVNVANSSISAHAGSSELGTAPLAFAPLPPSVELSKWHTVRSMVNSTQVSIQIDGSSVLRFSQTSVFFGSFGLGASWGHSALFTNVSLASSGKQMYSSSLTNKSALQDFLLGTNPLPVSVDGSRRDRIAYAGDLDIAASSAFASTGGLQFINGSITLLGSFQMPPGFFVPNVKIQQAPRASGPQANITGLIGYSFSLVGAMAHYYEQTGDTEFLDRWTPSAIRMLDWAHSQTLSNGLFNISNPTMGGDWNYYDPSLSGVVSKFNLIYAYSLKQWLPLMADAGRNTTLYAQRLQHLQDAINEHLWSNDLQAYYLSDTYKDSLSQEANALAILSDTTSSHGASTILSTLARELYVPSGALPFSNASAAHGWARKISPYASGYHLKAAFHANDSNTARHLLHTVWGPMSDPNRANYTGCMWETLDIDGTPGLGDSTSLCHAWSSGPTADLSQYVLGIQPVSPGFGEWKVQPQTLGLDWAKGEYPVPQGKIKAHWRFDGSDLLHMDVTAPEGTNGTVHLPSSLRKALSKYKASGHDFEQDGSFVMKGGCFTFEQVE